MRRCWTPAATELADSDRGGPPRSAPDGCHSSFTQGSTLASIAAYFTGDGRYGDQLT